jgi:hypothetical protein
VLGREESEAGCGRGKRAGRRGGKKNAGPAWSFRLKEVFFCKRFKQIQFEFKFEEFKFKLNHNIKTMQG